MKKAFTIFIGFIHDFAAGIWLATVLAVWWIERAATPEVAHVLTPLQRQFFHIGLVSTAMVFLAGMGRTFTYAYIGTVYGEESEAQRRKMLMVKHIMLLSIFGAGTYWQYTMIF
jgi:uncharacterized membrane protein